MAVYLEDFTFCSSKDEKKFLRGIKKTCYNTFYPFDIFPNKEIEKITFEPVTIFYGGNGSGKSTMLNIIAARLKLLREISFRPTPFSEDYVKWTNFNEKYTYEEEKIIPAGSRILTSEDVFDKTLSIRGKNHKIDEDRTMAAKWWNYNYEEPLGNMKTMHGDEYDEWKRKFTAKRKSVSRFILDEIGFNVKTGSNGENAFEFFVEKVRDSVLYLLDEPENSLSATWQMKLASYIEGMARFESCQFVIATHSPFLLGIRGAKIYDLDIEGAPVRKWTELENVREYFNYFRDRIDEFE